MKVTDEKLDFPDCRDPRPESAPRVGGEPPAWFMEGIRRRQAELAGGPPAEAARIKPLKQPAAIRDERHLPLPDDHSFAKPLIFMGRKPPSAG